MHEPHRESETNPQDVMGCPERHSLTSPGRSGWLWLLGLMLLSIGLLAACRADAPTPAAVETATATAALTQAAPAESPPTTTPADEPVAEAETAGETGGEPLAETSAASAASPEIGPLTFAPQTTAAGEAVEPDFRFAAGLTQLHALFDYANLSPNQIWTQVWYYNGNEVYRTSSPWLAASEGRYDYLVTAGGEPLPVGQWALEFYVNDALLSAGSFSIEAPAEPPTPTAAAATDSPAIAETPVLTGPLKIYQLVYPKWNGEKHDLYMADTNGNFERYIVGRAAGPAWSPNGRYIFFYGEEGVDQQVVNGRVYPLPGATNGLIRLDAAPLPANVTQLKLYQGYGWNDGTARSANISPDGSMIAYDGDRGGGRRIYFLGTEANQQFRYELIGEMPDWSPDGQRVVYRSGRNNQTGLWISNRDDTGHVRLTDGGNDAFPSWSPDGQTIAFSRDQGGNVDIYTVNVDGSNLQRLTSAPGHDTLPLYLPNGELVFRSARGGSWGIWKMAGGGADQVQIIANAPVGPDWAYSKMDVLR